MSVKELQCIISDTERGEGRERRVWQRHKQRARAIVLHTISNQGFPLFLLRFSSQRCSWQDWHDLFSSYCSSVLDVFIALLQDVFDWGCIHLLPMKCARRLEFLSTYQRYLSDECVKELRVASGEHHGGGSCSWNTLQLITTSASPDRWVKVCSVIGKLA